MRRMIWGVCLGLIMGVNADALPVQFGFRISFKDKAGSADINQPLTFLSQKSLDRRTKYSIAVDTTDLPVSPAYLDSVRAATTGIIHTTSRWLNTCVVLVEDSSTMQVLRSKPYITNVEWVGYFSAGLHDKPARNGTDKFHDDVIKNASSPTAKKATGNAAYYGATWDQTTTVNGDCMHDNGWKGEGITIAVLDNGFNYVDFGPAFDSLYNSGRIIDQYNIARDTNYIYGYASHGTEVLSVLAGYLPNYFVGAAPLANYALYVTEDAAFEQPVETDNLVAGIERADSVGADVISISLGYNNFDLPFPPITNSMLDGKTVNATIAANTAMKKGILTILSAGNEGSNGLLTPGDADSAITVGNVDVNKAPAPTSGYGPNASGTIKPDVCGMGHPAAVMRWNTDIGFVSGTSTATPSIAGFAACLLQGHPAKHPYEIKKTLQQVGHTFSNPTNQLGYGVPDFCAAEIMLDVNGVDAPQKNYVDISPNPFTDHLLLTIHSIKNETATVAVYDLTGKKILQQVFSVQAGTNTQSVNLPPTLAEGIYILKLQTRSSLQTNVWKIVKQ